MYVGTSSCAFFQLTDLTHENNFHLPITWNILQTLRDPLARLLKNGSFIDPQSSGSTLTRTEHCPT